MSLMTLAKAGTRALFVAQNIAIETAEAKAA
jgi:hypothetical protein